MSKNWFTWTCPHCGKAFRCHSRSVAAVRVGHFKYCNITSHTIKKQRTDGRLHEHVSEIGSPAPGAEEPFVEIAELPAPNEHNGVAEEGQDDLPAVGDNGPTDIDPDLKADYDRLFGHIRFGMPVNSEYSLFQLSLLALFTGDSAPFQTGWIRSDDKTTHTNWENYVEINKFVSQNALSVSGGDALIRLVKSVAKRHGFEVQLPMMKAIKSCIQKVVSCTFEFKELKIPYPDGLLSVTDFPKLKEPSGSVLDIIQILAEYLLRVDINDLILQPQRQMDANNVREISTYTTGLQFEKLCTVVSKVYGPDVFPIVLQFNGDGMAVDGLRKRSLKPHKFSVKNVKDALLNSTSNIFTCAYGPKFPYSAERMNVMLEKTVKAKSLRGVAAAYITRYTNQKFFMLILSQLQKTQVTPAELLVGNEDSTRRLIKFVILAPTWTNDNEESVTLCSCNYMSSTMKCRLCTTPIEQLHNPDWQFTLRQGYLMAQLKIASHDGFIKDLKKPLNSRNALSADDKYFSIKMKERGLQPGSNPLHDYMVWFMYHKITDLFHCQQPDMMHTLYRGLVIKNIEKMVQLLHAVRGFDVNCLARLDERLELAPYQQCLNPFSKKSTFLTGLSPHFPTPKSLKRGVMKSGSLEAQRTPDLLFWLMFCIGTEGEVVPNRRITVAIPGAKVGTPQTITFNPTEVILSSMAACLEQCWYARCDKLKYDDANIIRHCNKIADVYYSRLHAIASKLGGTRVKDGTTKRHIWRAHSLSYFYEVGSHITNDTALSEHMHIDDKNVFNQTSKRYENLLNEMTNVLQVRSISESLAARLAPVQVPVTESSDVTQYRAVVSAKSAVVMYSPLVRAWVILPEKRKNGVMQYFAIHPLIASEYITNLLFLYGQNGKEELTLVGRMMMPPEEGGLDIKLIGGVKIIPNLESGMKEFHIYATNSYGSNACQRFDCVQTAYAPEEGDEDDLIGVYEVEANKPFSQVLGIICITDNHNINADGVLEPINMFLLITTDLIAANRNSFLPYQFLKYNIRYDSDIRSNMVSSHIISIEAVYRPAILIPCPDQSFNFGKKFKATPRRGDKNPDYKFCTQAVRFWGLPYRFIDRSGYDLTFTVADEDENEQLPHQFFLNPADVSLINQQVEDLQGGEEDLDNNDSEYDDHDDHIIDPRVYPTYDV